MPDSTGATPPLDEAGCAELKGFLDWVRDHSASAVIITSRAQENWLGQVRRIAVGGLNRAEAAEYAGYLLAPFPAAQARRERRSFGELLDWLDGHPLAMRLTLPRLDTTNPGDLLSALQGTTTLAVEDAGPDRLSSLGACITYSFAHLSEQTRRLFPAVSLFYGVADEDVLTVFSDVEGVPDRFAEVSKEQWTAILEDAVRVGLLTGLGAGMYRIHPALPGYLAAGWRAESPADYAAEREACEQDMCTAFATFSEWLTGQIRSGDAALAFTVIGLQRRTLGAMLGYALDRNAWRDAESIVRALDYYWDTRGLGEEAAAWADRVLEATAGPGQTPSEPTESLWLYATVEQASRQKDAGHLGRAAQTYRRALAYLKDQPETQWIRRSISVIYHQLGMTAEQRGRFDEAEDWFRKSFTIKEELGDRPGMANTYGELGTIAQQRGQLDESEGWYRKSLAIDEEIGDRPGAGRTYHNLGVLAQDRERLDEAEDWYRKSLAIKEEIGDRPGAGRTYHQLGNTARARGRVEEAEDWYRKSLTIFEEFGDRPHMAASFHQLGNIAQVRGRLEEAEDWYRRSLAITEEFGDRPHMATTYGALGLLAEERGQVPLALQWYIRCVALFDQFPSPLTGTGPTSLARLTRQLGMPALEQAWQQITGQPVPQPVRDYINQAQPGGAT